ncbi:hypothetical protein Ccrd_026050 [Cynara cardunculus var. scolymus]|uniref:Uncharacterized protein n=1 Tax=Cynara cardunculus var. scolymus TaxID=59895 RepID=A0A103XDE3_CYNCS|nr:hypothetical protein Ccrd_026050 [Cynara cardunculus var. scolymus]
MSFQRFQERVLKSLSMSEMDKERRLYHKDCSCALHKPKDETAKACFHHGSISYSKKLLWNKCWLTKTLSQTPSKSDNL